MTWLATELLAPECNDSELRLRFAGILPQTTSFSLVQLDSQLEETLKLSSVSSPAMGRWRRQTNSGAPSDENGGQSGASNGRRRGRGKGKWHNHPPFRKHELEHIRSYLHEYRVRAERVCFGGDGAADVGIPVGEEDTYANPTIIAKHTFPALTIDMLCTPYLDLPSSLTAKQRRIVHELCVEVGLFHCGAGDRNVPNDRRIVVSIHYDGLEYVDNLSEPVRVPVMRCLPWYYRNDHVNVQDDMEPGSDGESSKRLANANNKFALESTLKGRQAIEALIDQPGRCLRDAHDAIDFSELIAMDLSQDDVVPNTNGQQDAWMLVDTRERMELCVKEITDSRASEIGLDLECYNRSKYEQATCLIQLHASGKDYVIDTLAPGVWDAVHLLEPLFGDNDVVKIGHSVTGTDVPSLHRDFGLFLVNCFDTYEAAKVLNLRKQNLAGLCEHYGLKSSAEYLDLKKEYQNCDWRRRPLTEKMIQYGRHDSHFLVKLRKLMIRDITRGELWDKSTTDVEEEAMRVAASLTATLGSPSSDNESDAQEFCRQSLALSDDAGYFTAGEEESGELHTGPKVELSSSEEHRRLVYSAKDLRMHPGLMRVISLSQEACLKLWKAPREQALKNDAFVNVLKQAAYGTVVWYDCHTKLYQELVRWRDKVAELEGTYPGAVCSLDMLVLICKKMPSCHPSLRQIDFFLPTIIADESLGYSQELLSIVASFRSDCVVSKGDKSVSAVLVRSYKDRITVGQGEVEGSNASKEENEPTSSSTHDNVRRAAILVVVSTALGALAVFAMRSVMKISKR